MNGVGFLFILTLGAINCLLLYPAGQSMIIGCHAEYQHFFECMGRVYGFLFAATFAWPLFFLVLTFPIRRKLKSHHLYFIGVISIVFNWSTAISNSEKNQLRAETQLEHQNTATHENITPAPNKDGQHRQVELPTLQLSSELVLVEENHARLTFNGTTYLLDSYIVVFEQPYYISLHREDGLAIDAADAERIAINYIKPRGCTSPLIRRPDLDQRSANNTWWIIGVAC